jgi:excisionase family DNA binding protein
MKALSTVEAAERLGIHRGHLQRLIDQKKVSPPPLVNVGGVKLRLWSLKDVARARKSLKRGKA